MSIISTPYYKALDFTLILLACSVAYWGRFNTFVLPLYYFLPATILAVVSLLSLGISNFYQAINSNSSPAQIIAAGSALTVSAMLTIACLYLTKTGEDYSRIWFLTSVGLAFIALLSSRFIIKKVFHISSTPKVIILLGGGKTAQSIKDTLGSLADHEISIAKQFENADRKKYPSEEYLPAVAAYVEAHRKNPALKYPITEIWITHDMFKRYNHEVFCEAFDNSSVTLVYIPELPELGIADEEQIQMIAGVPTITSHLKKNQKLNQLLKFIEDQSIAWAALILLTPLLILIAILIKIDTPGPVVFRQRRYGLGGKSFLIWKFRTMRRCESSCEFRQAQKNDPRVTRVGRFLRRTSLDELPQLFNVIAGSMSIVGPRPHPEQLNEQYRGGISRYMYRHASKPGITGLAQVKGFRGETADPELMKMRVKYDLEYVRNWSLLLDMKVLLMTFVHLFTTNKAR